MWERKRERREAVELALLERREAERLAEALGTIALAPHENTDPKGPKGGGGERAGVGAGEKAGEKGERGQGQGGGLRRESSWVGPLNPDAPRPLGRRLLSFRGAGTAEVDLDGGEAAAALKGPAAEELEELEAAVAATLAKVRVTARVFWDLCLRERAAAQAEAEAAVAAQAEAAAAAAAQAEAEAAEAAAVAQEETEGAAAATAQEASQEASGKPGRPDRPGSDSPPVRGRRPGVRPGGKGAGGRAASAPQAGEGARSGPALRPRSPAAAAPKRRTHRQTQRGGLGAREKAKAAASSSPGARRRRRRLGLGSGTGFASLAAEAENAEEEGGGRALEVLAAADVARGLRLLCEWPAPPSEEATRGVMLVLGRRDTAMNAKPEKQRRPGGRTALAWVMGGAKGKGAESGEAAVLAWTDLKGNFHR